MGKDIFPNLTNVKQLKQVNELMKDPEPELEPTGKKQEPEPEPLMPALLYLKKGLYGFTLIGWWEKIFFQT